MSNNKIKAYFVCLIKHIQKKSNNKIKAYFPCLIKHTQKSQMQQK